MTLRQDILDRVILWRMEALNGYDGVHADWLDEETDMIVRDKLPPHVLGQYDRVRENAVPLVDGILAAVGRRLQ